MESIGWAAVYRIEGVMVTKASFELGVLRILS